MTRSLYIESIPRYDLCPVTLKLVEKRSICHETVPKIGANQKVVKSDLSFLLFFLLSIISEEG